jgi:putative toxin-antitoxin system antitoxin component (TIGR02293 family)
MAYGDTMLSSEAVSAAAVLGVRASDGRDVVRRIREGFPSGSLRAVELRLEIGHGDLAMLLDIPERSLARRFKSERLSSAESDRLFRVARMYVTAVEMLGDAQKAVRWLGKPNRALGDVPPLRMLDTEAGAREVEDILGRIAFGSFS